MKEFDELQLYFGSPYVVNQYITIYQPTIGQIADYGEESYYSMVQLLTAIPSDMKSQLYDMKLDWTEVSDFQLFMMLSATLPSEKTSILLGNLNLQNMAPVTNLQNDEIVLKDRNSNVIIDELAYRKMVAYLCKLHNFTKKVEKAANEFTKKFMIEEDRQKRKYQQSQPYKSFLVSAISALKARQGYTKEYVKNMGLYEFTMELSRLQIIVSTDALLHGAYSGMMDSSKIPKEQFNWMREIK